MKERGISLIALIITIIVIIILAAISIAGVSGIVERSRYAKFCGDLDAVQEAVSQAYGNKQVSQALENPANRKNSEEIYEWLAAGEGVVTKQDYNGKTLVEIESGERIGIDLPTYGTSRWYVDPQTGDVYLLKGFVYEDKEYASKADIQAGGNQLGTSVDPAAYDKFHSKITVTVPYGAIPVKYENNSWVVADSENKSSWYDYQASSRKWANIVTVVPEKRNSYKTVGTPIPEEDIIGMFVYIPRYAYKITSGYHSNVTGNIEIAFIGIDNQDADGKTYDTTYPAIEGSAMKDYVVHPVFTNNPTGGGWDSELNGIWVAKFESSSSSTEIIADTVEYTTVKAKDSDGQAIKVIATGTGKTSTNMGDKRGSSGSGTEYVTIRPNVTSWRYISIPNIITKCKDVSSQHGITGDTHMMKNTEWGAVAYLAQSQYGNLHIWINPYCEGEINSTANYCSTLTGMVGLRYNEVDKKLEKNGENTATVENASEKIAKKYNDDDSIAITYYQYVDNKTYTNTYYRYNTVNGVHGSTTNNIYGIYDMSGGAFEYVAAYVNNGETNATTYCKNIRQDKYGNVYEKGIDDNADTNYAANNDTYYGDAVWEISNNGVGWNGDILYFPFGDYPAVLRGGKLDRTSYSGSFNINYHRGNELESIGFRVVLVAE